MKSKKLSLDLSDAPQFLDLLRLRAAQVGKTQKAIVLEALERYFASAQEDEFIASAANRSFVDWDNKDDEIYNTF
jgi:hypothetical protein